jgi:hypothetical protein
MVTWQVFPGRICLMQAIGKFLSLQVPVALERHIHIQVQNTRIPHGPWLYQYYYNGADGHKIIEAVIKIADAEYRPVPEEIQEEDDDSKCIVDTGAIVGFIYHFLPAYGAIIYQFQAFAYWKYALIDKHIPFSAVGAFHFDDAANKRSRLTIVCAHKDAKLPLICEEGNECGQTVIVIRNSVQDCG